METYLRELQVTETRVIEAPETQVPETLAKNNFFN